MAECDGRNRLCAVAAAARADASQRDRERVAALTEPVPGIEGSEERIGVHCEGKALAKCHRRTRGCTHGCSTGRILYTEISCGRRLQYEQSLTSYKNEVVGLSDALG